jgi:Malectin domain
MSKCVLLYYAPSDRFIAEQMIALLKGHDITVIIQHHFPDLVASTDGEIQQVDGHIIIVSDMTLKSIPIRSVIAKLGNPEDHLPLIPIYVNASSMLPAREYLGRYSPILWDQEDNEIVFYQIMSRLAEHREATREKEQQALLEVSNDRDNATAKIAWLPAFLMTHGKREHRLLQYQHSVLTRKGQSTRYRFLFFVGPILLLSGVLVIILGFHSSKHSLGRSASILLSPMATTSSSISSPTSQGVFTVPTIATTQPATQPPRTVAPYQIPTATPSPTPIPANLKINAGGPAVSLYTADTDYFGGSVTTTTNPISISGVANPAPQEVYQSNRVGPSFSYVISGLTAGSSHTVRLHFAETYWTAKGKRIFNVSINTTQVLSSFDIFATAGAANQAVVEQFAITADSSGVITIQFTAVFDQPQVSGIEII